MCFLIKIVLYMGDCFLWICVFVNVYLELFLHIEEKNLALVFLYMLGKN